MAYEDLMPGQYTAKLMDWSLEMAEKINQPKIVLKFEFTDPLTMKVYHMNYDGLIMKKDGTVSSKTITALKTVGFNSTTIADLNEPTCQINNSQEYLITVNKNEKGYWNIDWINIPGGFTDKVEAKKQTQGFDFSKVNGALVQSGLGQPGLPQKKIVKNYAPTANQGAEDAEKLPF